jgi:hypothetical protein
MLPHQIVGSNGRIRVTCDRDHGQFPAAVHRYTPPAASDAGAAIVRAIAYNLEFPVWRILATRLSRTRPKLCPSFFNFQSMLDVFEISPQPCEGGRSIFCLERREDRRFPLGFATSANVWQSATSVRKCSNRARSLLACNSDQTGQSWPFVSGPRAAPAPEPQGEHGK